VGLLDHAVGIPRLIRDGVDSTFKDLAVLLRFQGREASAQFRQSRTLCLLCSSARCFHPTTEESPEVRMRPSRLSFLGRWWVIVTVAVVIALTASAFSGSLQGTVRGRITVPVPSETGPEGVPGTVWIAGPRSESISVGKGGRFQVVLPAGIYRITGSPWQFKTGGCYVMDPKEHPIPTVVHSGATVSVMIDCSQLPIR